MSALSLTGCGHGYEPDAGASETESQDAAADSADGSRPVEYLPSAKSCSTTLCGCGGGRIGCETPEAGCECDVDGNGLNVGHECLTSYIGASAYAADRVGPCEFETGDFDQLLFDFGDGYGPVCLEPIGGCELDPGPEPDSDGGLSLSTGCAEQCEVETGYLKTKRGVLLCGGACARAAPDDDAWLAVVVHWVEL